MKSILIFNDYGYTEVPILEEAKISDTTSFIHRDNTIYYTNHLEEVPVTPFKIEELPEIGKCMVLDYNVKEYEKQNHKSIMIHPAAGDFKIMDILLSIHRNKILNPEAIPIYVNGKKYQETEIVTRYGDQILIHDCIFINKKNTIKIIGNQKSYTTILPTLATYNHHLQDFPNYRRSPRVIKRTMEEKVSLISPPDKEKISKGELATIIITPVMSVVATIAVSILMPRGPYVFITIMTSLISTTMAVTKYRSDKKVKSETNARKETAYENYLLKTRETLEEYRNREQEAILYHYPTIKELEYQVDMFSSRIYERDRTDDDFLQVNIGYQKDRSNITVTLSNNELDIDENPLLEEAKQIKEIYEYIDNKPITIDLKSAHVGLVGDKEDIHKQIKQIIAQLTFFHSYHDIEIIMLYNENYKDTFDYVKWYPHVRINAINVRGNIYLEKVRDQVLGSLAQIMKQRRDKRDERKREGAFTPHYVIFIDDYFLIMNHSIMEYLQEETTNLGFTLVFSAKQKADLPENIHTVVMIEDSYVNRLLLNNREMINAIVHSPQIDKINVETMARNLSVLQHQKGIQSYIPESITFFELYHVEKPEQLNIKQRWDTSDSHKSLSVPLGVRAKDDIVKLDLHEKAHGPHGLVAGTTGSGKSEIIQSYILSLAVNFHPYEVGFLLIDYKGGGMANLFNNLPHLLGTITNLDGSESMRALASIKSELQRRQRIFNEYGVNNIIKYNKLFKSGKAKEPLPTLFLISDEFAELKKEQPEFMSELVSVARIGRTLGIKLILATQKPSGVVDDQIWSNSKFKLALKVQNEGDSKEVIKTPDAAYITQAGRAYLQVGNNEIYELFQSAWSGATYLDDTTEEQADTLVYRMNDIGQAELINQDLSGGDDEEGNAVNLSQLDVTIDYIHDMYEDMDVIEVMKPWLPSLQPQIVSPYIREELEDITNIKTIQLDCPIGFVDIPEEQKQMDYTIDFLHDGNLAIFASSGFGKSFTLGTIMLTLASKNSPELLSYYIIDLGNSALIPYANLPHTADYMNFDATEKLVKFMKIMEDTIKERKKILAQAMVQNYETYNQMHEDALLKAIIVCIDNYDVIKELGMDFEGFVMRLSRDGFGLGIYVVITATRSNAIRYATMNNFKNKIAHYLYDKSEINAIVGRSQYDIPEIKGRSLIKLDNINIMQVYTPFAFEDNVEFIQMLKEYIQKIKNIYKGDPLKGIPVLPEVFTSNQFDLYNSEPDIQIKLGLCVQEVENVDAGIKGAPYIIVGPPKSGKTNVLELLISQMIDEGEHYIFDSPEMRLFKYSKRENIHYVSTDEEIQDFVDDLYTEIEDRREAFQEAMRQGENMQGFYDQFASVTIFIDEVDTFVPKFEKKYKGFAETLKEACTMGIKVISTVTASKLKGFDELTKMFKVGNYGLVLGNQGATTIFPVKSIKEYPTFGKGLLFDNGEYRRILIPKYTEPKGDQ